MDVPGTGENNEVTNLLHNMIDDVINAGFEPTMVWLTNSEGWYLMRLQVPSHIAVASGGIPKYDANSCASIYVSWRKQDWFSGASRVSCHFQSAPVTKSGTHEYRITIGYRLVNRLTVPLPDAGGEPCRGDRVCAEVVRFWRFDFHKGFWQMPLHPNSRETFRRRTVFPHQPVPQGASDAAVHFQAPMNEVLIQFLVRCVIVWIEDVLLFARTVIAYLKSRNFFRYPTATQVETDHPQVQAIYQACGVEHDPERLAVLQQMPLPPTGAAL
ncbi:LOW QUALITY PROTEIN: Hypothetical protein PHPALM_511 [Phytophthora palmivora]|uniref:Uncharacterized protein n=1 Tax=Phytophthora palmivora TaxID=4796 RepID=A0A2P4YUL5_9STRA|nr:LOW QUALITY PROTEIN: Hypothetical protein PHPALM_511 [Phytophthora palmivora]